MTPEESAIWIEADTTTHQDHVIAHVVGATVLGYFVFDETAYFLLDIGFVWHIYLNGEMGLVPHPVMVADMSMDSKARSELSSDIDALLTAKRGASPRFMTANSLRSPIQNVVLQRKGDVLRVSLFCECGGLIVETAEARREVEIMEFDQDLNGEIGLSEVAREEREFVRRQLADQLGREPTGDEVDEWLREHTESY